MVERKIALVTGASSGIGYEAALALKEKGFRVYGAARRRDRLAKLSPKGIEILQLDVTDEASMKECVDTILSKEGRIDVLVNNAGYGSYGAVEDVPIEEARRQLDVNLFGLARMTQLVLPSMRKHHFGKIVNISSMGGRMYTPFGAWYHATKYAVEGFSDCLRMEVSDFGIDVVLIEPGGIKTDWGIIAADHLEKTSENGPYAIPAKKVAQGMRQRYQGDGLTDPKVMGDLIAKAVTSKKPKARYLKGAFAKPLVFLKNVLPTRLFDKLVKRAS